MGSTSVLANLTSSKEEYRPPFFPLGASQEGIYRMALASVSADARPTPGTIFSFATQKGGREAISWLNTGEEGKLEREAADFEGAKARWEEAQKALARIL
jgi:hypothetical protein